MRRILVIEDEKVFRSIVKDALQEAGYEVDVAADGDEGMKLFAQHAHDVVITDILMPNKEGLETILEFSAQAPDVKIIAISGGGVGLSDDLLNMAVDFGAKYALRKPFQMTQLVTIVQNLLNEAP